MESAEQLANNFSARMLNSLMTNNTLRGAWAEELVGHHLHDDEVKFTRQWSYYDLSWRGRYKVSVKHSVSEKARFPVAPSPLVWDSDLSDQRQPGQTHPEGWRGHRNATPQYWCHLYVFAWLPTMNSIENVLNPEHWRFTVLSRREMCDRIGAGARTMSPSSLKVIRPFVPGVGLYDYAERCLSGADTPEVDDRTQEQWIADNPN